MPFDLRRELLRNQEYSQLVQTCSLPEFASICSDDRFWADRLGIAVEQWRESGIQPLTERYLRLLWKYRKACEPGSERFVNADSCLRASVRRRRADLIEYFLARAAISWTTLEALGEYGDVELIKRFIPSPNQGEIGNILSGAAIGDKRNVIAEYLPRLNPEFRNSVISNTLVAAANRSRS